MAVQNDVTEFIRLLEKSIETENFLSFKLTNKRNKEQIFKAILGKLILIKKEVHLSLIYRSDTQDTTKNFKLDKVKDILDTAFAEDFYQGEFDSKDFSYYLTQLDNGKTRLRHKPNMETHEVSFEHDKSKYRMIPAAGNIYLQRLGVTTTTFQVRNKSQDKYKQINKYVEIIDDILKKTKLPKDAIVVDMGSGKGYLTFSLYDYFTRIRGEQPKIYGVEMRPELVDICNDIAKECAYDQLEFKQGLIQDVHFERIDFLLALHACDTATDFAIYKGIRAGSQLIICAPCCHKQVRKRLNPIGLFENITKHGILKERQAEILTDTIRAMLLEAWGYKTRVFEFISTTHTPKNVLIVASLDEKRDTPDPEIMKEIEALRLAFRIQYHYLERILQS